MHCPHLLDLLLQVVQLLVVLLFAGAGGVGSEGLSLEPALDLLLQLLEAHFLLLQLHLHVELRLLHAVVLLAGLVQPLLELADSRLLVLHQPAQPPLLALQLREALPVALRVRQLLLELLDGFLVLFELLHLVLQEDVLLPHSRELLLVLADGLQQFLLQVVVHYLHLLDLGVGHGLGAALPVLLLQLLQLLQPLPGLHQFSLVLPAADCQLLDLLPQQFVLIGEFLQLLDDLAVHAVLRAVGRPFADGVLHDDNECVLAPLIEVHDGLDVVLLVLGLHEHRHHQLEEAQDVRAGLVLGDFDEVDVLGQQRLPALLYVALHPLQDDLQVGQLLDPLLGGRLQVLQRQGEAVDRGQQVGEDHAVGELADALERVLVVGREGGGKADEGVLDVGVVGHCSISIICLI